MKDAGPVRIIHVIRRMDRGGAETFLMNVYRGIDRTLVQFDFVEQEGAEGAYDDEIRSLGGRIYRCPSAGLRHTFSYIKWWQEFLEGHREYRIIHGHARGTAPIYLSIAKSMGRHTIVHCHNNERGLRTVPRHIWQYGLRWFPEYRFACSLDAGHMQYGHHRPFTVIKNGIDTAAFTYDPAVRAAVRQDLGLGDAPVIGHVGRFEEQKNHAFLIDIFREVHERCPRAVLMLVGDGYGRPAIEELVHQYSLQDRVLFLGSRNDVRALMQAMDVFILPSLFEGLPLVLIEAQTAGLPCIISADVISEEVKITDLVRFVSLRRGADQWAEIILRALARKRGRENTAEQIRRAGYDIGATQIFLTEFYLSLAGEEGK